MSQEGQENPPEEGSGWGWGWFSEAAKVAKAAYDSNVKPALQSMESSTSQFVQDVTRAIELDQEEEPEVPEPQNDQTKSPESSYPSEQVSHPREEADEEVDDSLLSDALGSIAYLGGVMKKIGSHIGDVNSVEETLKSGGKKLASAWEEAYQFITEDEERQDQLQQPSTETPSTPSKPIREASPSTPSAFPSTPSTAQSSTGAQQRPSLASPTFASLFEAKLGQVHFATLENMSMQASLQLQQIVRKLTESQRALLTKQQEELRAIYAEDVATTALDLETLKLPGESPSSSREKFQTQLAALHQKLAFYSSRTASLQAFALKAVAECDIPEDGANLKALSEGTLNYRGKMQLEGLRQVSEFCALAVHQILLATEHVKESYETAEDPKSVNLVEHARIIHGLALTTKELVWNISSQIVASMKTLGNSFKSRVPNAQTDPDAQAVVQSTLKRISSGINNLQLDLATAASQILDASRFTLALVQHFEALNASNATATTESHTSSD